MALEFRRVWLRYQIRCIQFKYRIGRLGRWIANMGAKVRYTLPKFKSQAKSKTKKDLIGSASKAIASPPLSHPPTSDGNHGLERNSPIRENLSEGQDGNMITSPSYSNPGGDDENIVEWMIKDARMQSGLTHLQLEYLKQEIDRLEVSLNHQEWMTAADNQIDDLEYILMKNIGRCYVT